MSKDAVPTPAFLFAHPSHLLALGLGSGLAPRAPGTFGTLFAWPIFLLIKPYFGELAFGLFLLVAFALGVAACERTGRDLGVADHGAMVWDEVVAFWLVLWLIPGTLAWQAAGFVAFRVFDIAKPPPIRWLDSRIKGGFGVMIDDIVAALFALVVLAAARFALGGA